MTCREARGKLLNTIPDWRASVFHAQLLAPVLKRIRWSAIRVEEAKSRQSEDGSYSAAQNPLGYTGVYTALLANLSCQFPSGFWIGDPLFMRQPIHEL